MYDKFLILVGHLQGINIIFDPHLNFESKTKRNSSNKKMGKV
jgi:hypothetical protein